MRCLSIQRFIICFFLGCTALKVDVPFFLICTEIFRSKQTFCLSGCSLSSIINSNRFTNNLSNHSLYKRKMCAAKNYCLNTFL